MSKFKELPKRIYCDGPKKMSTFRFPEKLLKRAEEIAREQGWTTTDLLLSALDQYVQWVEGRDKK